jgi:hypothetical protein
MMLEMMARELRRDEMLRRSSSISGFAGCALFERSRDERFDGWWLQRGQLGPLRVQSAERIAQVARERDKDRTPSSQELAALCASAALRASASAHITLLTGAPGCR